MFLAAPRVRVEAVAEDEGFGEMGKEVERGMKEVVEGEGGGESMLYDPFVGYAGPDSEESEEE